MKTGIYRPTMASIPFADRYPVLAVEDGRMPELVSLAGDDARQADALAYLVGEAYPGGTWSA